MALCIQITQYGGGDQDNPEYKFIESADCSLQIWTQEELDQLVSGGTTEPPETRDLVAVLDEYFAFDEVLFGEYLTTCLVTFIVGLTAGFIYKKLSR